MDTEKIKKELRLLKAYALIATLLFACFFSLRQNRLSRGPNLR